MRWRHRRYLHHHRITAIGGGQHQYFVAGFGCIKSAGQQKPRVSCTRSAHIDQQRVSNLFSLLHLSRHEGIGQFTNWR